MTRFINTSDDTSDGVEFIDLDQVSKVKCLVQTEKGGVNLKSIGPGKIRETTPDRNYAVIVLITPGGSGRVRFTDFGEAERWLKFKLDIEISFSQLIPAAE